MKRKDVRDMILSRNGAWEDFPFDNITPVFKVGNKMFALIRTGTETLQINLKCEPELAMDLRDVYEDVTPGYHMNKKHWNSITCGSDVDDSLPKIDGIGPVG
jgi:predicted DNA-binding protein (MmcQ/YjbR family)